MARRRMVIAALAAGLVALNAPAVSANHATVNCRFDSQSQAAVTGQDTWEGFAQGYIIGNAGESVTIRCVVKVNGSNRAATAWGSGTTVATTADRVTYVRTLTEVVQLCAQYTTAHGAGETCFAVSTTQLPPQEVIDAVESVSDLVGGRRYPRGTIDISGGLLPTTYHFHDFDPPYGEWNCQVGGGAATCTPPGNPHRNWCGTLNVMASTWAGSVTGVSECSGVGASATSVGSPQSASQRADTAMPWRCESASVLALSWTVTCSVG